MVPHYVQDSALYTYLRKKRILHELQFDYSEFGKQEKREIRDLFGEEFSERQLDHVVGDLEYSVYNEFYYYDYQVVNPQDKSDNLDRSRFIDEVINAQERDWYGGVSSNSVLRDNYFLKLHRLRTLAYWEIAGLLDLSFLSDFMRIPVITGHGRQLRESIRMSIQNSVDHLVKKS